MTVARRWCLGAAAASWVLCIVMQLVAGDVLPPEVSVSQYGVGPHGWLFTLWVLSILVTAALVTLRAVRRPRSAAVLVAAGSVGALVMGFVRTDAGGLQQSLNAKVHMAGAVVALALLPLGFWVLLEQCGRRQRRVGRALTAATAVSLVLLVVSALGVDTAGIGAQRSWALWQSVGAVLEMVLMAYGAAVVPLRDGRARRGGTGPGGAGTTPAGDPAGGPAGIRHGIRQGIGQGIRQGIGQGRRTPATGAGGGRGGAGRPG
ncbi:DUF998 domain-containing protein [Nakamurella endophytica]|uniref:DUF998 domain-containing protein n=1 Tax=Nakamurella endophytica TaxID=1748367 RepID=A0A917SS35_9ACTN|nr:DUF998 domain-containing protein [Nakamurella endophytica]GGL93507.1 hypothetical protein GCM10011594_11700 [Nakamurella endophytica]